MFQDIVLGTIQGLTEWLPLSSEGLFVLIKVNIFHSVEALETMVKESLFLHLGTFFAALIYLRKDVIDLFKTLFNYKSAAAEKKKIFNFLLISAIISGILGIILVKVLSGALESNLIAFSKIITLIIGLFLLFTAYLQIKSKSNGQRRASDLKNKDSWILGLMQGLATLPGLSRSGLTISSLLLLKFDKIEALRLSFLMSLPIVLVGNIVLNLNQFVFNNGALIGLLFSFIFGLLTISLLFKISKKINFGWFVLIFALLVLGSLFIK